MAESQVKNIARWITAKLKEAGAWDGTLTYQVELVASDIVVYRTLRDACLAEGFEVTQKEVSREGNERVKVNPLIAEMRLQSDIVRRGLDALTMNIKSRKRKQEADDGLSSFLGSLGSEFNGD